MQQCNADIRLKNPNFNCKAIRNLKSKDFSCASHLEVLRYDKR